jgi:hypothetical protein
VEGFRADPSSDRWVGPFGRDGCCPAGDQSAATAGPLQNKKLPGGETNPASQQIDFCFRSPQQNPKNRPSRQVFLHFFGMEITWK